MTNDASFMLGQVVMAHDILPLQSWLSSVNLINLPPLGFEPGTSNQRTRDDVSNQSHDTPPQKNYRRSLRAFENACVN